MILALIAMLLAWTPFAQEKKDIGFDIRAKQNLLMGKGAASGQAYYDVVITKQPTSGVLIKLPYTKKGGKFSFDLHHRIAMTGDFGLPASGRVVLGLAYEAGDGSLLDPATIGLKGGPWTSSSS